ncbi:alpha/beta hydrolase [Ketobacter sp.]|uniref:alpha/beta hydrolase n=1 Tax=Ketobacter sp. TaxID=2083498 RepID=UPI000F1C524D|nr:alpha/beta hydrolase [Ketobacter sp.]RLT94415.1 MAG: alpha/beta hydrolase [Ketobacter sp.]
MIKHSLDRVQTSLRKGLFTGLRWAGHRPGKVIQNLHYGRDAGQSLDIYLPRDSLRGTQMVFLHGGGWHSGNKAEYAYLGSAMAAYGITCAVVGYRLYPAVRYPLFIEDVAHAIAWLRREGPRYGFGAAPLYLMGHSAGAHIACMVALDERYRALAGLAQADIGGVIGLSGVYRFRPEVSPVYSDIFAPAQPGFEAVKPINYVGEGKVPILMLHGDRDKVIGSRNAQQMLQAAQAVGQPVQLHLQAGYGHVRPIFDFLPFMPNHQRTMSLLLSFMAGTSQ